jgi:hypothetical protein
MIGKGLPDGIFSNQKSKFRAILEGLAMEDVGMYILRPLCLFRAVWYIFGHFVYLLVIWYFYPIFVGNLVYLLVICYICWLLLYLLVIVIFVVFWYIFGYLVFFPVLVCCTKKNLATLFSMLSKFFSSFFVAQCREVICEMSRGSNPRPVDQAVDVSNVLTML